MKKYVLKRDLPTFKTGEIYKAYTYGYALENYPKGLVALLIERLFFRCARPLPRARTGLFLLW